MSVSLREAVEHAFLAVHAGRSTDDVVIDPDLNDAFLNECRKLILGVPDFDANW